MAEKCDSLIVIVYINFRKAFDVIPQQIIYHATFV